MLLRGISDGIKGKISKREVAAAAAVEAAWGLKICHGEGREWKMLDVDKKTLSQDTTLSDTFLEQDTDKTLCRQI